MSIHKREAKIILYNTQFMDCLMHVTEQGRPAHVRTNILLETQTARVCTSVERSVLRVVFFPVPL